MDKQKAEEIAVEILKEFEGFRPEAYLDRKSKDAVLTLGFGQILIDGRPVQVGDKITYDNALSYLKSEVTKRLNEILSWAKNNGVELNEHESAALCSFAYNEGVFCLEKSTLANNIIDNNRENIKEDFEMYDKMKINGRLEESDSLLRRRRREYDVFMGN